MLGREVDLGRRVHPIAFNATTRVLRVATSQGGAAARAAQSLLQLTPEEWLHHIQGARLRGAELGRSNDHHALYTIRRLQDVLVYPYHRGDWWRLNAWNPQLDPRVPQRDHEPATRPGRQRTTRRSPKARH